MTKTIEQLTSRIAELEGEKKELQALLDFDNARLDQIEDELEDVEYLGPFVEGIKVLKTKLAASQAYAEQLREALQTFIDEHEECTDADDWMAMLCSIEAHHVAEDAIAPPRDTSALDAYVAEKVKEAEQRLARRMDDIKLQAERYVSLQTACHLVTKQRDLAVDALKWAADVLPPIDPGELGVCVCPVCRALSTIKESEAK